MRSSRVLWWSWIQRSELKIWTCGRKTFPIPRLWVMVSFARLMTRLTSCFFLKTSCLLRLMHWHWHVTLLNWQPSTERNKNRSRSSPCKGSPLEAAEPDRQQPHHGFHAQEVPPCCRPHSGSQQCFGQGGRSKNYSLVFTTKNYTSSYTWRISTRPS